MRRLAPAIMGLMTGLGGITTPALAQGVDSAPPGEPGWRTVVVAVVLVGAIAVGSFVGAKRPHNDD